MVNGVRSYLWGNKEIKSEPDPLAQDSLELRTTSICTLVSSSCWEQMKVKNEYPVFAGKRGPVKSSYTSYKKWIKPLDSRTITSDDVHIQTAVWYGAQAWKGAFWFTSIDENGDDGILAVTDDEQGDSRFYPIKCELRFFHEFVVPILVPSHSNSEYICIFESGLTTSNFSLWNIRGVNPVKVFSQTGFLKIFFLDDGKSLIALRPNQGILVHWNLETREQHFLKEGFLYEFNRLGPYNPKEHILLTCSETGFFGFNLLEKTTFATTSGNLDSSFDIGLLGDQFFYCKEGHIIKIFDIKSGKLQHMIESSEGSLCVYKNSIFTVDKVDRKKVWLWDAVLGAKSFERAPQEIINLYCAEGRLIALCSSIQGIPDQIFIWDMETEKLIRTIASPQGTSIHVQDITDGKLTLFIDKIKSTAEKTPEKKLASLPLQSKTQNNHYTHPNYLTLVNHSIHLDIWDTKTCTLLGSIEETFSPSIENAPILASYSAGRLIIDGYNTVIIQNFE